MRKTAIVLLLLTLGIKGMSQITIDESDMPAPGDTLRVSISTVIPGDFTKTGTDTTWDFSSLFTMNQQIDSFVTPPLAYLLYFNNANLASPGGALSLPGLPVSSPFTFFDKSSGTFGDLGLGFMVTLGSLTLPMAVKYDYPDEYYEFPMTASSVWSSGSSASLGVPGLASYYTSRERTSMVDGWGTVITPWGSFPVIRVKSHLVEYDSIYIDTLSAGIPITRDITQYKWLAKGKGIPVLQIDQEGPVATAIYRDSYRQSFFPVTVNPGPDTMVVKGSTITISANATGGTPPYTYFWSTLAVTSSISVIVNSNTRYSVAVIDAANNTGFGSKLVSVKGEGVEEQYIRPLVLFPNPAGDNCQVQSLTITHPVELRVLTTLGMIRKKMVVDPAYPRTFEINLSDLPAGIYIVQIRDDVITYRGKLIHQLTTRR